MEAVMTAMRRTLLLISVAALLLALTAGTLATPRSAQSDSPCGKGIVSEESGPHAWHPLARGISPMLDIIIPPLADQVVATGQPKEKAPARPRLLARAERGLLSGAVSAVVSAGLAALGTLDGSGDGDGHAAPKNDAPDAGSGGPASSCPEDDGSTLSGGF
jgi:hypothetical protein